MTTVPWGGTLGLMRSLRDKAGARFTEAGRGELICSVAGITAVVQTHEEMFILNEIFVSGVYNFDGLFGNPIVVWDIGMNVGLASLYFASRDNTSIMGYEPFTKTYKAALVNFALNPQYRDRIQPLNFGIGDADKTLCLEYSYAWKGNAGIFGIPDHLKKYQHLEIEEITIKNACDVLDDIERSHPGAAIVAKIDCEGSEYEIIDVLARHERLQEISLFMIEWHNRGPASLTQALHQAGFVTFCVADQHDLTGMIRAVRMGGRHPE